MTLSPSGAAYGDVTQVAYAHGLALEATQAKAEWQKRCLAAEGELEAVHAMVEDLVLGVQAPLVALAALVQRLADGMEKAEAQILDLRREAAHAASQLQGAAEALDRERARNAQLQAILANARTSATAAHPPQAVPFHPPAPLREPQAEMRASDYAPEPSPYVVGGRLVSSIGEASRPRPSVGLRERARLAAEHQKLISDLAALRETRAKHSMLTALRVAAKAGRERERALRVWRATSEATALRSWRRAVTLSSLQAHAHLAGQYVQMRRVFARLAG